MSNNMNMFGFLAWPLYEKGVGRVFKVLPAQPSHNFFEVIPPGGTTS